MSSANPHPDDAPLFAPGQAATAADTVRLIAKAGPAIEKVISVTGREKFEHIVLYCLTLLDRANGKICAFYIEDFDDCDEPTLKVIQRLIGRSGFTVKDFIVPPANFYKGFWAWRTKVEASKK